MTGARTEVRMVQSGSPHATSLAPRTTVRPVASTSLACRHPCSRWCDPVPSYARVEASWHQALRRRIPAAAAESRVRGARASAALDGAEVDVAVVRDLMRGAVVWSQNPDPIEAVLKGAVQATVETEH